MKLKFLIFILLVTLNHACRKIEEYFRPPDTEVIASTILTNLVTGYTANVALSCISGNLISHVTTFRSNEGFPCTSLMVMDMDQMSEAPFPSGTVSDVSVAALWADENTGILSIVLSDYNAGTTVFSLIGITTVPVIRHDGNVAVALADMDINFDPDQQSILEINLNEMEISSEYDRLEAFRPSDIYIAVEQKAYFIDVTDGSTPTDLTDDSYSITGGGQLVEATNTTAEVFQQAMINVLVSPLCNRNPLTGLALIQATGAEARKFPELGSALLQFHDACDGMADVLIATGMYLPSNGSAVEFNLH